MGKNVEAVKSREFLVHSHARLKEGRLMALEWLVHARRSFSWTFLGLKDLQRMSDHLRLDSARKRFFLIQ